MKDIAISAKTLSGTVGLVVCYALSIYFFWESQMSFGFKLDPDHSRFTKAMYHVVGREYSKYFGVVAAFVSVHASWAWRYSAGNAIERLWKKYVKKTTLSAHAVHSNSAFDRNVVSSQEMDVRADYSIEHHDATQASAKEGIDALALGHSSAQDRHSK